MESEDKEGKPKYTPASGKETPGKKYSWSRGEETGMPEQDRVVHRLYRKLEAALREKSYTLYDKGIPVQTGDPLLLLHPDLTIVPGKPGISGDRITNPVVIIEVWSPAGSADFQLYRNITSLQEYILIDPVTMTATVHTRSADDSWQLDDYNKPTDHIAIASIETSLSLAAVYEENSMSMVMEALPEYNYISPEQYLERERSSERKSEYYKGEVFSMAGASLNHVRITKNLNRSILPMLRGKPCDMYGNDLRIHIPENSLYTYPDLSIICGEPVTTDKHKDTVINPSVIIEILSRSTRDYDRGTKFVLYRNIPTLREYLLIDSEKVAIELYKRNPGNSWQLTEYRRLSDSFTISTIRLVLQIRDIYEGMDWNPAI